jgi:hypothetical protein
LQLLVGELEGLSFARQILEQQALGKAMTTVPPIRSPRRWRSWPRRTMAAIAPMQRRSTTTAPGD